MIPFAHKQPSKRKANKEKFKKIKKNRQEFSVFLDKSQRTLYNRKAIENNAPLAKLDIASVYGTEGQGFESLTARQEQLV